MLYKIDGNLDIKDVSAKYNVIVLLSNNMFYTKGVIDILQDELKQMKKDIIAGKYDMKRK